MSRDCIYYFWPFLGFVNLLWVSAAFWWSIWAGLFSNQTLHKHSQKLHTLADAWYGQKKLVLIQDHAPNFVHLKVENHRSAQVAPTCQDLEEDSGTASQILLQCMKCPHKHCSFLACSASEMCPASGSAFQTRPRAGWSSCFTFAFQYHPPLLSVAGDTQGGPWGTSNFTTNTSTISKVEEMIHGYARHWNGYSSRESI